MIREMDVKGDGNVISAEIEAIVEEFYRGALTVNDRKRPDEILAAILSDDFQSLNAQGSKPKQTLIDQVVGFWQLIPDLRWNPQDIVIDPSRQVAAVRSLAMGTPNGPFMGLHLDGTKSFQIDTMDIHEFRDGKICKVHHLEDWATALRQLA